MIIVIIIFNYIKRLVLRTLRDFENYCTIPTD